MIRKESQLLPRVKKMARIRTIKPEFWTDEKIVQLPFEARLLFEMTKELRFDEDYEGFG